MSQLEKMHALGKVSREKEFRKSLIIIILIDSFLMAMYGISEYFMYNISTVRSIITVLILIYLGRKTFDSFHNVINERKDKALTSYLKQLGLVISVVYCSSFMFASLFLIFFR